MQENNISIDFLDNASAAPLAAAMHARCFADPWDEAAFVSALDVPGTVIEILTLSDQPAAFALYRAVADEAEILTLGTLPEFRTRQMATQLLNDAFARLEGSGVRTLYLEVGSQNFAALRLYTANGFEEIGRRRNYYNHGGKREDAVMMKRSLNP